MNNKPSLKFTSFMEQALEQAEIAFNVDEVPIGAVVVDSKTRQVIARAHNQNITLKDATAHAEIIAIRQACLVKNSSRLDDCDLYVTLEPCPMCSSAISLARIRRLYYGAADIKFGGVENGARVFSASSCHHKPEIYNGIDVAKAEQLLRKFFTLKRY